MSRRKRKAAKNPAKSTAPRSPVQEALQVTWRLKGDLKRAQRAYLRIGEQLVHVRDAKLWAELKHPDMEDYGERRLGLGHTSLYKYLRVYDWVRMSHSEWLAPKVKGFIPDLDDASGLMWVESELKKPGLDAARQKTLEELQKKGLEGTLRQSDVNRVRRDKRTDGAGIKSFLSKLRLLRKRGSTLVDMPQEAIAHLDAAIDILKNDHTLKLAGLFGIDLLEDRSSRNYLA